jgi:hypothetical protein
MSVDRLIINYLPIVLRSVVELKALLAAEQPELETLWNVQAKALDDQFVLTASVYGIGRWEKMLGIYPKDTDGLEMRRARVMTMLQLKLPYSRRWLEHWLDDLCGPGRYNLVIKDYTIEIDLGYDQIPEAEKLMTDIYTLLSAIKPANMLLDLNGMRNINGGINVSGAAESALILEVWPSVTDLDNKGSANISSYTEYVCSVEIYPETA